MDELTAEEIRDHRGTLTEPGRESPWRDRPVEESLDLFERMRKGEFEDGAKVLRAKIDMASPNINLRDPVLYRIRHATHHRTGDAWCIYPMYDYTHAISDAIEHITHSLCTLEFEDHRPLYDWTVDNLPVPSKPRQIEFARLNLTYTVMSKRKLLQLVQEGLVSGWDDPRMPTLVGLRRRGFTPESIRDFAARIGVAKRENMVDVALLENAVRDDLNRRSRRAMAVLRPLRVVIENYREGLVETIEVPANPEDPSMGHRWVPFSKVLYIEQDDFREVPPPKYFRLSPGREVRLRGTYFLKCERVVKDERGEVVELRCTYDPATRGGSSPDGRKVKAHDPLGVGRARGRRRGPAVRPAVHGARPPRRRGRARLEVVPQPALAGRAPGLQGRAGPGERRAAHDVPVRAPRLLLRGSGHRGRPAGVQPDGAAARHLGADRFAIAVPRRCSGQP